MTLTLPAEEADGPALEIEFQLPPDYLDILQPTDDDEARSVYDDLFGRMFPSAGEADRTHLVDGLLIWRARMVDIGFVMHGVVALPVGPEVPDPVHWHVLAGLVDAPESTEVDVGALAQRVFGAELGPEAHVESFPSDMGWGVGLITTAALPDLSLPMPRSDVEMPASMGLAGAVVGAHGQTKALLVLGVSFDSNQVVDLAALVALISAHAVIRSTAVAAPAPSASGDPA